MRHHRGRSGVPAALSFGVNPSWQRPRAPEIAVFSVPGGVVRGETLFATGAEQFEWQAEEGNYAGSRFHCYSRPA